MKRQIEKRLERLERMHSSDEQPDSDAIREVMKSQMFGFQCFLARLNLGRELSYDEKLTIAFELFNSGKWKDSIVAKIVESLTTSSDKIVD
jgi:hypothetical protein